MGKIPRDFYEVLKVRRDATETDIRESYLILDNFNISSR